MSVGFPDIALTLGDYLVPSSPQSGVMPDVGSGANRQLVCCVMAVGAAHGMTSITCGSASMSLVSGTQISNGSVLFVEWWAGPIDSVTGTPTVTLTFSGSPVRLIVYCGLLPGADLIQNGTTITDTDGSPVSLPITSAAGDLALSGINHDGTGIPTTNQDRVLGNGQVVCGVDVQQTPTGSNPTHTWATGGANWGHAIVSGISARNAAGTTPATVAASLAGVLAIRSVGTRLTVPTP